MFRYPRWNNANLKDVSHSSFIVIWIILKIYQQNDSQNEKAAQMRGSFIQGKDSEAGAIIGFLPCF